MFLEVCTLPFCCLSNSKFKFWVGFFACTGTPPCTIGSAVIKTFQMCPGSIQKRISSWGDLKFRVRFEPTLEWLFIKKNPTILGTWVGFMSFNSRLLQCELTSEPVLRGIFNNCWRDTGVIKCYRCIVGMRVMRSLVSLPIPRKGVMNGWVQIHLSCRLPVLRERIPILVKL